MFGVCVRVPHLLCAKPLINRECVFSERKESTTCECKIWNASKCLSKNLYFDAPGMCYSYCAVIVYPPFRF